MGAKPTIANELPKGVARPVIETARFHEKMLAMNEALMLGSVRQHELTGLAENLNEQLLEEIGERKRAEEALRESEQRYRKLFNSIDEGFCIIEMIFDEHEKPVDYRFSEVNPSFEKQSGLRDATGKRMRELSPNLEAYWFEIFGKVALTGVPVRFVNQARALNNGWFDVYAFRIGVPETRRVAILFSNITERTLAERALSEAKEQLSQYAANLEKEVTERTIELTLTNKQLEAFVYSIAHDLRAPLRAMQGFATMLVEEVGATLNITGKDYADRINKSAQFMDSMLSDLLDFSRISQQRVELTSVDLKTVVESVLSRLQKDIQEKNAQVQNSGPWPAVVAHESTLAQVLFNLVSNALKFVTTDVPPQIRLRAEVVEASERASVGAPEHELAAHAPRSTLHAPPASTVRVWVEDNGPGIAPDYQSQIFRLFTRLDGEKYAGTGIGLTIVEKGIERMRGRVGVESIPGQGSRFWFELEKAQQRMSG